MELSNCTPLRWFSHLTICMKGVHSLSVSGAITSYRVRVDVQCCSMSGSGSPISITICSIGPTSTNFLNMEPNIV